MPMGFLLMRQMLIADAIYAYSDICQPTFADMIFDNYILTVRVCY